MNTAVKGKFVQVNIPGDRQCRASKRSGPCRCACVSVPRRPKRSKPRPALDLVYQMECLADDVEVPPEATQWTEDEVRTYFESGGMAWPLSPPALTAVDPKVMFAKPEDHHVIRWAVNTSVWKPAAPAWLLLLGMLPEEDATKVMKFHFRDDQKRAMASRLLQRCAGKWGIVPDSAARKPRGACSRLRGHTERARLPSSTQARVRRLARLLAHGGADQAHQGLEAIPGRLS